MKGFSVAFEANEKNKTDSNIYVAYGDKYFRQFQYSKAKNSLQLLGEYNHGIYDDCKYIALNSQKGLLGVCQKVISLS